MVWKETSTQEDHYLESKKCNIVLSMVEMQSCHWKRKYFTYNPPKNNSILFTVVISKCKKIGKLFLVDIKIVFW